MHVCDELNIFLFFKDRAFYETYVREYINDKIEKTFVDYFLLQDARKLKEYTQSHNLELLNAMEKAMLVIYL